MDHLTISRANPNPLDSKQKKMTLKVSVSKSVLDGLKVNPHAKSAQVTESTNQMHTASNPTNKQRAGYSTKTSTAMTSLTQSIADDESTSAKTATELLQTLAISLGQPIAPPNLVGSQLNSASITGNQLNHINVNHDPIILRPQPIHHSSGSSLLQPPGTISSTLRGSMLAPSNPLWGARNAHDLDISTREKRLAELIALQRVSEGSVDSVLSQKDNDGFRQQDTAENNGFPLPTIDAEKDDKKRVGFDANAIASDENKPSEHLMQSKIKKVMPRMTFNTARSKLRTLNDFVKGHGLRKIMMAWNTLEIRFTKSPYFKTVMMKDDNGLTYPLKVQVLPISTLISILCSPKVKVYAHELTEILGNLHCSTDEFNLAKKIAGVRLLLGPNKGEGLNPYEVKQLIALLEEYLKLPEKTITLEELKEEVFPKDPVKREQLMKSIDKERENMVQQMLEQKKQKEDAKALLEGRRLRSIESFEETLREVQFVRGPLTFRKSYILEDLRNYCMRIIQAKQELTDAELPMESIVLIGIESFPKIYHARIQEYLDQQAADDSTNASESKESKKSRKSLGASMKSSHEGPGSTDDEQSAVSEFDEDEEFMDSHELMLKDKMKDKIMCKLDLCGPPTYVQMLRTIVSYSRGFDGMSFRDVIEMLQAYCSIKIQATYRGAHLRRRYFEARRRWRHKFGIIKRVHFRAYASLVHHISLLKRYCWRKLKAWNFYLRQVVARRDLFRICYWPFYVWRRESIRQGTLTHKVRFLCTRVYPTYIQLINFRAWKRFTKYKLDLKHRADTYWRSLEMKAMRDSLLYLHSFAADKKKLHQIWVRGGIMKLRQTLALRKSTPFQLWYAYTYYRRSVRNRAKRIASQFFKLLLPEKKPLPAPNPPVKRVELAKLREEKIKQLVMKNRHTQRERRRLREEKKRKAGGGDDSSVASTVSKNTQKSNDDDISTEIDPASKEYGNASKMIDMEFQPRVERIFELRNGQHFVWQQEPMDFDLDSDCDDMEDIPDKVSDIYLTRVPIEPLAEPEDITRISWIDNFVVDKVRSLHRGFLFSENWAFFETATRYYRLMPRVFRNLRVFSIVNRNSRNALRAYDLRMKRLVFNGFMRWMLRDAGTPGFAIDDTNDGEKLRESVRNIRWSKMLRRRELVEKIKAKAAADPNSKKEEEEYWSDIEPEEVRKKSQRIREIRRFQMWSQEFEDRSPSPSKTSRKFTRSPSSSPGPFGPSVDRKGLSRKSGISSKSLGGRSPSTSPQTLPFVPTTANLAPPSPVAGAEAYGLDSKSADKTKKGANVVVTTPSKPSTPNGAPRRTTIVDKKGSPTAPGAINRKVTSPTPVASGRVSPADGLKKSKKIAKKSTRSNSTMEAPENRELEPVVVEDPYQLPNILAWDREDRSADQKLSEGLMAYSRSVRQRSLEASVESGLVSQSLHDAIKARDEMVDEVMVIEGKVTEEAIDAEIAYSRTFKLDAARIMLDVLYSIRIAVLDNLLKVEMKKYFRLLRLPMLLRRSRGMLIRKKMINWMRICRRMRSLNKLAPYYNTIRTKWILWNRWLKYLESEALLPTPGLVEMLRRRMELMPKYNELLESRGIIKVVYIGSQHLAEASTDLRCIFYRWSYYVQDKIMFRRLKFLVFRQFQMRLLHKCFLAMKTGMQPEETKKIRLENRYFPFLRIASDISQIAKRVIAKKRKTTVFVVTRYNQYFDTYIKKTGIKCGSFKKFVQQYDFEVGKRLATEQRVLVDAFEKRGWQECVDVMVPSHPKHPCIPEIMFRVEGMRFTDPNPQARYFPVGPGGTRLRSAGVSSRPGSRPDTQSGLAEASSSTASSRPLSRTIIGGSTDVETKHSKDEMPEVHPGHIFGLPVGFKLNKIRLTFGEHMGIAGWQVNWCADGLRDVDGPRRGHWFGGANSVHELLVPRGDFVIGMEYYHDGSALMGMRLKLFSGGWTKWVGGKSNLSTQSVYIGVEMSDRLPFEDEHVPAGPDEALSPAYPREFVIGLNGVQTLTRVTNPTLVVRKIKEQFLLSYFWVKDALDKILTDMHEKIKDKWLAEREEASLASEQNSHHHHHFHHHLHHLHEKNSLPSVVAKQDDDNNSRRSSIHSRHVVQYRQFGGGVLDTVDEGSQDGGSRNTGGASAIEHDEHAKIERFEEDLRTFSMMSKYDFGTGSNLRKAAESQFFDVMRMRALEITVARQRGLDFARRLWNSKEIRNNPELKKLSNIRVVINLTNWFFNAISKRLIRLVVTESQGMSMLADARGMRKYAELLKSRAAGNRMLARTMEATPQPWAGKSLLSPQERALRKVFKDRVKGYLTDAHQLEEECKEVSERALLTEKTAKNLLPRMQLSKYTVGVFLRKLAAARQKETLLQYISVDTVKAALTGNAEKSSGLPTSDMETIINNLHNRVDEADTSNALDELVQREVAKERVRKSRQAGAHAVANSFQAASLHSAHLPGASGKSYFSLSSNGSDGNRMYSPDHGDYPLAPDQPHYLQQTTKKKRVLAVDPSHFVSKTSINPAFPKLSQSMSAAQLGVTARRQKAEESKKMRVSLPLLKRDASSKSLGDGSIASSITQAVFDDEDV